MFDYFCCMFLGSKLLASCVSIQRIDWHLHTYIPVMYITINKMEIGNVLTMQTVFHTIIFSENMMYNIHCTIGYCIYIYIYIYISINKYYSEAPTELTRLCVQFNRPLFSGFIIFILKSMVFPAI
jgi:Na+-transporting NADH:ubiquinone oxidoreductase subunit NqrE